MKRYEFIVHLSGKGNDENTAWNDAVEAFSMDPGVPENFTEEEVEDTEENPKILKDIWVCPHCGKDDVQSKAWVKLNKNRKDTYEFYEFIDGEEDYCPHCEICIEAITLDELLHYKESVPNMESELDEAKRIKDQQRDDAIDRMLEQEAADHFFPPNKEQNEQED